MNDYCVYVHTNLINGKIYIGITNDIERRWRNNGIEYKPKKYNTRPFWNAIEKYGWDSFKHEILINNLTFEEACEYEKYYIALSGSRDNKIGYNVAIGGNGGVIYKEHPRGMLGKTHSEEFKKRLSELMKGKENPFKGKTWGDNHPKGMLGKHHTEEHNKHISKLMKEKKINCKAIKIIYPDGKEIIYDSIQEAVKSTGISYDTIRKLIKTNKPYELSNRVTNNREFLKTIVGIKIEKIDNTEVTQETKES